MIFMEYFDKSDEDWLEQKSEWGWACFVNGKIDPFQNIGAKYRAVNWRQEK